MYAFGTRLEKSAILDEVELVTGLLKEDDYIITAHRGFSSRRAENSREALVLASDQRYVDFIEFDVRLTSDGKLVLSHDNKAPDGTIISDSTYDEIVAKTFTYHVDTTSSLFESASEGFIRARN